MQNEDYYGGETTREKIQRILAKLRGRDQAKRQQQQQVSQYAEPSGYDNSQEDGDDLDSYAGGARKRTKGKK